ncbi:MAG: hypothetical protein ABIH71_03815 [Candidatus Omnitrophota bacterium]|nr:translation initiation factor eIF-2B [Candidatus Omnitrophota bacterium]
MKLEEIKNATVVWGALSEEGITFLKNRGGVVVVAEGRPGLVGLYHNVELLKKENIEFVYCVDNVLGLLFYKGKIGKMLVMCKKIELGVLGRPGSLQAALLSKIHGVSVEFMVEGEFDFESRDKGAASLGGKMMVLGNDCGGCVVLGKDEVLGEI